MKHKIEILFSTIFLILTCAIINGCDTDDPIPEVKSGCIDGKALNFDILADKSDGSCKFSAATFYARFGFFNGIPIIGIDVSVEGNYIGTITSVYPGGPGNCSASGTVSYTFESSTSIDWNTNVHLASGASFFDSGTLSPSSINECIKVNVTN